MFYLGVLPKNTKFNAETAEAAEKNPIKLCDLCALCVQNVVISFHGVCLAHDDSVVDTT